MVTTVTTNSEKLEHKAAAQRRAALRTVKQWAATAAPTATQQHTRGTFRASKGLSQGLYSRPAFQFSNVSVC